MWFVYVLLCKDNSLYTGISNNPQKRFLEHLSGKGGRYTRSHKPIKIIYLEKQVNKNEALKREASIKKLTRPQKIREFKLRV